MTGSPFFKSPVNTGTNNLSVTNLESALAADKDGKYRQEVLAQLKQIEMRLQTSLRGLLSRETYTRTKVALDAVQTAREVITKQT